MIRLIWYRTKVLRVLKEEFDYYPAIPGFQMEVFNACTRQVRSNGGNEYDAAIAFMMIQISALMGNSDSNRAFTNRVVARAYYCVEKANLPETHEVAEGLYAELIDVE